MIVVDRIQVTEDGEILVPPYHTGHLGLIPGSSVLPDTQVHISFNSDTDQRAPTECEVVVSTYRGDDIVPSSDQKASHYEWACERFLQALDADLAERLKTFDVQIGPPSYPRPSSNQQYIRLNTRIVALDWANRATPIAENKLTSGGSFESQIASMKLVGVNDDDPKLRLINAAKKYATPSKPTIFLSYPRAASDHGKLLIDALSSDYATLDYQVADGEVIVEQVVERIRQSDFFIAVWYHEFPMPDGRFGVSPWMHFEYGIANAKSKDSLVVHSEKLHEAIWKRVNSGIANREYSDVLSMRDTIPFVVDYCRRHIARNRYMPATAIA